MSKIKIICPSCSIEYIFPKNAIYSASTDHQKQINDEFDRCACTYYGSSPNGKICFKHCAKNVAIKFKIEFNESNKFIVQSFLYPSNTCHIELEDDISMIKFDDFNDESNKIINDKIKYWFNKISDNNIFM